MRIQWGVSGRRHINTEEPIPVSSVCLPDMVIVQRPPCREGALRLLSLTADYKIL